MDWLLADRNNDHYHYTAYNLQKEEGTSGVGRIITMKTFSFKQSNKESGTVNYHSKPDVTGVPLFTSRNLVQYINIIKN